MIRSKLMIEIGKYTEQERLTQAEAAKRFGVKQPRISDLVRGKVELFAVDGLIAILSRIGMKVDVRINRSKAA